MTLTSALLTLSVLSMALGTLLLTSDLSPTGGYALLSLGLVTSAALPLLLLERFRRQGR